MIVFSQIYISSMDMDIDGSYLIFGNFLKTIN